MVISCTTDGLEVCRDGSSPALKVASLSLAWGGCPCWLSHTAGGLPSFSHGTSQVVGERDWTVILEGFPLVLTKSVLLLKYRFDQRSIKPGESWKPVRGRNCPGPDKPY